MRLVANERGGRAVLGEVMRGRRAQEDSLKDRVVGSGGEHVAFALLSRGRRARSLWLRVQGGVCKLGGSVWCGIIGI